MIKEAEERDHHEMKHRLEIWDDDESDETFYTDRARWRALRRRRLDVEEEVDRQSKAYEEKQTENLRRESEQFLARQMAEMQSLQEEQRKAGMLLDDGAPVKLNMSVNFAPAAGQTTKPEAKKVVLGQEDEEDNTKKKKITLTKREFSFSETGTEKIKERLSKIKELVPKGKDALFKAKVRWDGMNDVSFVLIPLINILINSDLPLRHLLIASWNLLSERR
jgi:RNA-binding protein 25